jgi:CBS domain-containing protein
MHVGDLMRKDVVTVGPAQSLREAAAIMTSKQVGAAVVATDDSPGIISERDLLRAVAAGADLDQAQVRDHMTSKAICASTNWDAQTAARTMLDGGFRHLVVVDEGRLVGILSIRDLAAHLLPPA